MQQNSSRPGTSSSKANVLCGSLQLLMRCLPNLNQVRSKTSNLHNELTKKPKKIQSHH